MILSDTRQIKQSLSKINKPTIVILTGSSMRHDRFALRIQEEFKINVLAYYRINNSKKTKSKKINLIYDKVYTVINSIKGKLNTSRGLKSKFVIFVKEIIYLISFVKNYLYKAKVKKEVLNSEKKILSLELSRLYKSSFLSPINISSNDVNSINFLNEIKILDPYFFVVLGGPIISKKIINSVRGFCINQHAGHSPDFKGSSTTDWALYHRDLSKVSSTVHLMGSAADTGSIIRRSQPCLRKDDKISDVFIRVVVLGTELLIESIHDIIKDNSISYYDQNKTFGRTYLASEMNSKKRMSIKKDFRNDWLKHELKSKHLF